MPANASPVASSPTTHWSDCAATATMPPPRRILSRAPARPRLRPSCSQARARRSARRYCSADRTRRRQHGANVPLLFWAFRLMVACGFYFIALFALAFWYASRRAAGTTPLVPARRPVQPAAAVDRQRAGLDRGGGRQAALTIEACCPRPWGVERVGRASGHQPRRLRAVLQRAGRGRCAADGEVRATRAGRPGSVARSARRLAMLEYDTLRLVWWLLLGVLLAGFAVMDSFDLGVAALLRLLAHDDEERRALLETVEPVWEGNQGVVSCWAAAPCSPPGRCSTPRPSRLPERPAAGAAGLHPASVGFGFRSKAARRANAALGLDLQRLRRGTGPAVRRGLPATSSSAHRSATTPCCALDYAAACSTCCGRFRCWSALVAEPPVPAWRGLCRDEGRRAAPRAAGATTWRRPMSWRYAAAGAWLATGVTGFHLDGAANTAGSSNHC